MLIKKFVAETMNEALLQVKQELGEDAVILQSRTIEKSGLLSFMKKAMIEVTAATPDQNPPVPEPPKQTTRPTNFPSNPRKLPNTTDTIGDPAVNEKPRTIPFPDKLAGMKPGEDPLAAISRRLATRQSKEASPENKAVPSSPYHRTSSSIPAGIPTVDVQSELKELRENVRELAEHLKYREKPDLPPEFQTQWMRLIDSGMDPKTATDIIQTVHVRLNDSSSNLAQIETTMLHVLENRLKSVDILQPDSNNRPVVIALVGPTGVGKTTTLAKMATNRKIFGGKKVALISTDTYRVAAVEQLKTFASIASLPMEVVYRPEEIRRAINSFSDMDVVLIDTAGRSQNDAESLSELVEFMDETEPDELLLVLSAGTRIEDQKEMVHRFGMMPTTSVIVTKLDEVTSAGHLLDLARILPKGWTYLTTGQSVPDDIILANTRQVARYIADSDYFKKCRKNGFRH